MRTRVVQKLSAKTAACDEDNKYVIFRTSAEKNEQSFFIVQNRKELN